MEDSNWFTILLALMPFITALMTAAFVFGIVKATMNGLKSRVADLCNEIPKMHKRIDQQNEKLIKHLETYHTSTKK